MRISWVSMPGAPLFRAWEMFEDEMDGTAFYIPEDDMGSLMMVSKAKTAPDIYGEREMTGPEWDEPKDIEVAALYRTGAVHEILANDPYNGLIINHSISTPSSLYLRNPGGGRATTCSDSF